MCGDDGLAERARAAAPRCSRVRPSSTRAPRSPRACMRPSASSTSVAYSARDRRDQHLPAVVNQRLQKAQEEPRHAIAERLREHRILLFGRDARRLEEAPQRRIAAHRVGDVADHRAPSRRGRPPCARATAAPRRSCGRSSNRRSHQASTWLRRELESGSMRGSSRRAAGSPRRRGSARSPCARRRSRDRPPRAAARRSRDRAPSRSRDARGRAAPLLARASPRASSSRTLLAGRARVGDDLLRFVARRVELSRDARRGASRPPRGRACAASIASSSASSRASTAAVIFGNANLREDEATATTKIEQRPDHQPVVRRQQVLDLGVLASAGGAVGDASSERMRVRSAMRTECGYRDGGASVAAGRRR